jgi:hypothetical protein
MLLLAQKSQWASILAPLLMAVDFEDRPRIFQSISFLPCEICKTSLENFDMDGKC